jgi:peptidoglycan/LPS O-acetylase OafA/YrhL
LSDSQPSPGNARDSELPALTGLRGLAALWVLLYHLWAMAGGPPLQVPGLEFLRISALLSTGWAGVDLFFCLSAFLLVLPYARWRYAAAARPDTGRYLLRRVLRIYPAYLFQLGVLLFLAWVFGIGRTLNPHELWNHLFLWFYMGWQPVAPLVGVWFTLPIEFSFYLILPFLAPLIDRRRWPWLLMGAVAVTAGFRMAMFAVYENEPVSTLVIVIERLPGRLDQFVIGMLAGAAFVAARLRGWKPSRPGLWLLAGVLGLIAVDAALLGVVDAYWRGHPLLFVWHTLFSICLVPILLACAWDAKAARTLLANRSMRFLGDISFGVYLWHMPIVLAILPRLPEHFDPAAKFGVLLVSVFPLTVLVAAISRRYVELPFLRRKPALRLAGEKGQGARSAVP